MMEFEKRAYIRATCICEAEIVLDEDNDETIGISVIDLAAGGLKFISEKGNTEYVMGTVYSLRLSISESDVDMDDIMVDIKIRRIESGGNDVRTYGASFENITSAQSIRIDEILQYKKRLMGDV